MVWGSNRQNCPMRTGYKVLRRWGEDPPRRKRCKPKPPPQKKEEYVVPIGAFANPENVSAKLAAAKIPHYTEAVAGNLTRVRAGPFATREAAEEAATKLKGLGLEPGAVTAK